MFDNKVILVTGGTGSFGKKFTEIIFIIQLLLDLISIILKLQN